MRHMAVVPIYFKMCYKDQTANKGCFIPCANNQEILGGISTASNHAVKTECFVHNLFGDLMKSNKRVLKCANRSIISANASEQEKPPGFPLNSSARENHLKSLDSYFRKFKNVVNQRSLKNDEYSDNRSGRFGSLGGSFGKDLDNGGRFKAEKGLSSVDDHLSEVDRDPMPKDIVSSATSEETPDPTPYPLTKTQGTHAKGDGTRGGSKSDYDETSGLYTITTMASINIAVYLFEIASPIKNSDSELFSLPSLYGAKINHLILYGEWWRLLTPMFLHTGILHIGVGCWALLAFGPRVCKAYGRFTFCLIYILGGLSGNLTSFLHTPDPTVGGTGPVFAIMGAWLMYQYQNKDAIRKDVFENMYQKAIFVTTLGFVLSTFGPIDDWSHFGSAFTGIAYGFMTCPTIRSSSTSSETGQDDGITLVGRNVDPCKSLLMFSIFVLVLCSLLLVFEPPLGSLAIDTPV